MKRICLQALPLALLLTACCQEEEIPTLRKKLYSENAGTRNEAALSLARCGEKAEEAVPRLGAMLFDENRGVQSSAAYALRQIDTKEARRLLSAAIANRDKK